MWCQKVLKASLKQRHILLLHYTLRQLANKRRKLDHPDKSMLIVFYHLLILGLLMNCFIICWGFSVVTQLSWLIYISWLFLFLLSQTNTLFAPLVCRTLSIQEKLLKSIPNCSQAAFLGQPAGNSLRSNSLNSFTQCQDSLIHIPLFWPIPIP